MANQFISCSSYIDYSTRRNCPLYNIDNCATPDAPILCPMIENAPRSPCTRFICSAETEFVTTSTTSTTSSTSTIVRHIVTEVVKGVIAAGESASAELKDSQVDIQVTFFLHSLNCFNFDAIRFYEYVKKVLSNTLKCFVLLRAPSPLAPNDDPLQLKSRKYIKLVLRRHTQTLYAN